jgi:gamma-glutamylcyclotransferase (GGCT)/AIG2-like uncharacterized protein YtfP
MIRLFVYGTLQTGERINYVLTDGGARKVADARTRAEWELRDLGHFPAMTRGYARVLGELWEVPEALLPKLDAIEAGYDRKEIRVHAYGTTGRLSLAFAYVLKPAMMRGLGARLIRNGNWKIYSAQRAQEEGVR